MIYNSIFTILIYYSLSIYRLYLLLCFQRTNIHLFQNMNNHQLSKVTNLSFQSLITLVKKNITEILIRWNWRFFRLLFAYVFSFSRFSFLSQLRVIDQNLKKYKKRSIFQDLFGLEKIILKISEKHKKLAFSVYFKILF